jgi:hypothetical protein
METCSDYPSDLTDNQHSDAHCAALRHGLLSRSPGATIPKCCGSLASSLLILRAGMRERDDFDEFNAKKKSG